MALRASSGVASVEAVLTVSEPWLLRSTRI